MKQQRSREMDETAERMVRELEVFRALLLEYCLFDDGGHFENYVLGFLRGKLENKPLRAYYSRKLYEYLREYPVCRNNFDALPDSETLFLQKIPFLFEVIITIQYLDNQILDEKYEVKLNKKHKVIQNLIASNILREFLFVYIEREVTPFFRQRPATNNKLVKAIRRLFLWVDLGQFIDKNHNHYKNWQNSTFSWWGESDMFDRIVTRSIKDIVDRVKASVPNKSSFIDGYFQRIYLSNVYFFRCITEQLLALSGIEGKQKTNLLTFSIQFGFMLQIINDYADFAYEEDPKLRKELETAGKKTTDIFSDLLNTNITLPLIYHLNKGNNRKIEIVLKKKNTRNEIVEKYPKQIFQEIVESGAIEETALRSIELAEAAKTCLDRNNPHTEMFADMCDMAVSNKFLKVFFPG